MTKVASPGAVTRRETLQMPVAGSHGYIIEVRGTAAGLVVSHPKGWRFVASDRRFERLEGAVFDSPAAAEWAIRKMVRDITGMP